MIYNEALHKRIEDAGHTLVRDEDGRVDIFVLEFEIHNGPGCSTCHSAWCHHCPYPKIEPCKAPNDGGAR